MRLRRIRGRRALVTVFAAAMLLASYGAFTVLAVNNTGAFELDGNAVTTHGTGAPDDWDRVCHEVTGTDCSTTSNTTGSTARTWISEPIANASTYAGGGSKDPSDISSWAYVTGTGGLPGKDILLHTFAAKYALPANPTTCPSTNSTCNVLFFGMDRFDNSGDAQNGFWLFQNSVGLGSNKVPSGTGFSGVHANGDLLIVSDFSVGGTTSTITVYSWDTTCKKATGTTPGTCGDANLRIQGTSTAANCATSPANSAFCGIVNAANGTTSPWSFLDKSGNTSFAQGEFYEGGLNLSNLSNGAFANECFASFLSETRSSTSTTATLKDFILGNFQACGSGTQTTPKEADGTTTIPSTGLSIGSGSVVVKDFAEVTVTGTNTYGGTVTFHLCGPADLVSQGSCVTGGTLIGSAKQISGPSPSDVTSDGATVTSVGNYCWRADYSGDSSHSVPASHDSSSGECFTINAVTPTLGTTSGGTVLLGHAATDTGTLTGTANQPGTPVINPTTAGAAAGGTLTFTLYKSDCLTLATGTGTNPQTVNVSGDGTYGPVSFTPDAVGTYHWVASYSGNSPNTLVTDHNTTCNDTGEDVTVQQLTTSTVTTPVDGSGTALTSPVALNTSVFDYAKVTNTSGTGTPTGTVTFSICNPSQVTGTAGSEVCASGGTQVGSPVTLSAIDSTHADATSTPAVVANQVGVWCFRAVYTPDVAAFVGSSDASHGECFTVTTTSSATSAQNWLPNDSATISTVGNVALNGTLSITLRTTACDGTVVYTEPTNQTLTNVASGATFTTTNSTYKVDVNSAGTFFWRIVYTPSSPFISGVTRCETSTLSVNNAP